MKKALFLLLLLLFFMPEACAEVLFNEVMASNATYTNGHSYDWVELFNSGDQDVSLAGWHLSNDPFRLDRWAFPSDTVIKRGGYLLVYCGGKNAEEIKGACVANFKLSASGDEVYLTSPDGNTVMIGFGEQYGNVSYGIPLDGEEWMFLENATPGTANDAIGYGSRAQEPVIETAAGFYESGIDVAISAQDGLQIRYTTDCSEPTRTSSLYTEPLHFSSTTVVRARAFSDELLGSISVGSTYFIDDPAPVPVVSLYTDNEYLFSKAKGLMVTGYSENRPNYMRDWQYPCQIEYFDKDGNRGLSQAATFKIAGKTMRKGRQKSFAVYANNALGSDVFSYPFFENRSYTEYSSVLLRYSNSDSSATRMRDAAVAELSEGLGLYYQAGYPILLYLNGEYWGHYNLRERANKDSLAQWEGITDPDIIDGVDILEATGVQDNYIVRGRRDDWTELVYFCKNNDLNEPDNLQYLLDRMDIDSLFDHAVFAMVIGNFDANNTRMYRFPGGKWKFMLHDLDVAFTDTKISPVHLFLREGNKKSVASSIPHWPLTALLDTAEYRDRFLKRASEIIGEYFLYDTRVAPVFSRWRDEIAPLMQRHISKFHNFTFQAWQKNVQYVMDNARQRPAKVIGYICQQLHLKPDEKEYYFGDTLRLLQEHNAYRR